MPFRLPARLQSYPGPSSSSACLHILSIILDFSAISRSSLPTPSSSSFSSSPSFSSSQTWTTVDALTNVVAVPFARQSTRPRLEPLQQPDVGTVPRKRLRIDGGERSRRGA